MNRKVKSFTQTVFLSEQYAVSKVTTRCSKYGLSALTQVHNRYCLVDNMLFEIGPEIRCSGVV